MFAYAILLTQATSPFEIVHSPRIPVHDLARGDVEDDDDLQSLKGGGHH
jgi:hypothetical protein